MDNQLGKGPTFTTASRFTASLACLLLGLLSPSSPAATPQGIGVTIDHQDRPGGGVDSGIHQKGKPATAVARKCVTRRNGGADRQGSGPVTPP
jgi:hypothetical protein